MRLLNERIASLQRRGLAPEWMPQVKFTAHDIPHLVALAVCQGAAGALDLADIFEFIPKIVRKITKAAITTAMRIYDTQKDGPQNGNLLMAAGSLVGLFEDREHFFFWIIENNQVNGKPEVQYLFDWITQDIGEATLRQEAKRTAENPFSKKFNAEAAMRFLQPEVYRAFDDLDDKYEYLFRRFRDAKEIEISPPDAAAQPHLIDPSAFRLLRSPKDKIAPIDLLFEAIRLRKDQEKEASLRLPAVTTPEPVVAPVAAAAPKWTAPATPHGVILSSRASKEIRREKRIAKDRLDAGLALLGQYRAMRMGEITKDAYYDAVRLERFDDSLCFSDPGSFKAFEADYTVFENSKKYVLERHLKWGKGNNAVSALRMYYAWDPENQLVIVGSAPRHLPVWNRK